MRSLKVSLEERKRKLKELKKRTNCQACGETGHWAGDPECRKGKSSSSSSTTQKTANLALGFDASNDDDRRGYPAILEEYDDD